MYIMFENNQLFENGNGMVKIQIQIQVVCQTLYLDEEGNVEEF